MKLSDVQYNKTCYMGDCRYFFTLNSNYSGYTADKLLFHVLDHSANKYISYDETKGEFTAYLADFGKGYVFTPPGQKINPNGNGNGLSFDFSQINWPVVGIGAVIILGLILAK